MRILYVTTISLTMNAFFKPHIEMLVKAGHQVDIACNYSDLPLHELYNELGCKIYQVDFSRSPLSFGNIKACGQLKNVVKKGNYDIVHCHTPNAAAVTRLVCRKFRKKKGLKVFYTAHGFHFFNGAPLKNWMLYYPVEKFCSHFTDVLITINQEDYALAKRKMSAKRNEYVPGVGIAVSRFTDVSVDRVAKRQELGVPEDALLLVSVGELSARKNHMVILQAMKKIDDARLHYVIVGKGDMLSELQSFADNNGLSDRMHLLGYRTDIAEIYNVSDVCCLPSVHEGLPVALMEGMACGLSCVTSRIRGSIDLIDEETGFLVDLYDVDGYAQAISTLLKDKELRSKMGEINKDRIVNYSIDTIVKTMKDIYES